MALIKFLFIFFTNIDTTDSKQLFYVKPLLYRYRKYISKHRDK